MALSVGACVAGIVLMSVYAPAAFEGERVAREKGSDNFY